jgi:16S rRNA (guanine(966)-N(2))-methyltransferase RsmD
MRIIGGKYRSRVLAEFAGENVRPTSDRAREALFNILALKIYGARVLDLFAGSGALGIESLSRGAKEVVFNDFSKDSIAIVKKNLTTLKIPVGGVEAKVVQGDYLACLEQARGQFDLIFIDPPYALHIENRILDLIKKYNVLAKDGLIIVEHDFKNVFFDDDFSFDTRKCGSVALSFLEYKQGE